MIHTNTKLIVEKYIETRAYTEQLCKPLRTEDFVIQPAIFASPPKWHLAHTTWFFEEFVLKNFDPDYKVFDEDYAYLFNSYYNNVGPRTLRAERGNLGRPVVRDVLNYRKHVTDAVCQILDRIDDEVCDKLMKLGINHEQQHQELLITDLKYTLGHNPIFPRYKNQFDLTHTWNQSKSYVKIEEGVYPIGYHGEGFCYDNELGRHKSYIQPFEIADHLVTNKEYIEFIQDGGYQNFNLWLDEGWSWVKEHEIRMPLYWHEIDDTFFHYTLNGLKEVNPSNQLCHISFYEASAFAEWKGYRLPTEFEWEVAADQFEWGTRWEWTNSAYLPYPGFHKAEGAVGEYNGKFMINQMVLRGSSSATAPGHSRKTYRNFFHPDARWQFTGIRLVK